MPNTTAAESTVKVSLVLLCSIKLWFWSLSSIKHETLTVTLILRQWELTAYIESSENVGTKPLSAKFAQQIEKHFVRKERQILKLSKNYFAILELPLNLIWSLSKA